MKKKSALQEVACNVHILGQKSGNLGNYKNYLIILIDAWVVEMLVEWTFETYWRMIVVFIWKSVPYSIFPFDLFPPLPCCVERWVCGEKCCSEIWPVSIKHALLMQSRNISSFSFSILTIYQQQFTNSLYQFLYLSQNVNTGCIQ